MTKKAVKQTDEYVTIKEAAQILEVYEKTVSNWFDKGIIEGKKTILGTRKPLRSSVLKIRKRLEGGWRPRDDK
jgi:predicted site-specific integrase-resolvase